MLNYPKVCNIFVDFKDIKYGFLRGLFYVLIFGIPFIGISFSIRSCIVKRQNRTVYIDNNDPYLYHTSKRCHTLDGKDIQRIKHKDVSDRYYCPICKEADEEFATEEARGRW